MKKINPIKQIIQILQSYFKSNPMKYAMGLGFFFALSCVLGRMLEREHRTFRTFPEFMGMLAALFVMTIVSGIAVNMLFGMLSRLRERDKAGRMTGKEYREKTVYVFYVSVILLCWTPVFLAYYPSVFAYDAEGQLYQVIAHDYSTHHPLIHTLFLGAFFKLGGNVFGSYQTGMALHSVVQMVLMAMIFAYAMLVLYREKTSRTARMILLLFYALFPTNSILALSTTKDVLFSGLVLLYVIKLYEWLRGGGRKKKGFVPGFILISVLMLLFRNNAVYAWLLSQLVMLCFCGRKKMLSRRYAAAVLVTVALFAAGSAMLKTAVSAQSGSPREMLSIPLQQMARTRVCHEEEIAPDMRRQLDSYLPSEWVFAAYNPYLADPVKNRAVIHDDPAGLVKTWVRLGLQFPAAYVDAFLENSIGYWYVADKTHASIYGIGTQSGFGYLSTDNRTMPAGCEIVEHSFAPGLRAFMERIVSDNEYQKIPVLSVIFAPAFYWWLFALYMAFFWSRKEYEMLLPGLFLAAYYLTLLLSPAVLIRYMYPFVVCVPVMLCFLTARKKG